MAACTRKGTIVADNQERIPALFYQSESGKQPVRDWLIMTHHPYIGSSLDELLEADGVLTEVSAITIKRVLAWQVAQEMSTLGLSKTEMAAQMRTSRTSLDRLLDPENTSVTLKTLERAATVLGKRLQIALVDIEATDAAVVK